MRTGIFGGSFDPVHRQHLQIALAALLECHLDEVWFVPVFQAVHKPGQGMLGYQQRRQLLLTALRDLPGVGICDIEEQLGGPSYTFRTIDALAGRFPDRQFFLIIGGDSLCELPTWKNIDKLVQQTEFIVVDRPGYETVSPIDTAVIHRVACQLSPVSSTVIRAALQSRQFNLPDLDSEVLLQILHHDFYDCLGDPYRQWLRQVLDCQAQVPPGLQEHMRSATRLAVNYALELGLDPRPALIATMAHDLFRSASDSDIITLAGGRGFRLNDLQRQTPMLAHGPAAAVWLQNNLADIDAGIVAAVRDHTFPVADSPQLTRIVATADALDPFRQLPARDRIRDAAMPFAERFAQVVELKKQSPL